MSPDRKLWGRATSYNVQKVAWVLQELNLPYDRIDAGGAYGGLDDAHYVAMNPNRRVPTLIEGDLVLWESNAICRCQLSEAEAAHPNRLCSLVGSFQRAVRPR